LWHYIIVERNLSVGAERAAEAMPILNSLEKTIAEDEEYNENTMQALCHCYKVGTWNNIRI
jgi:hypothetical protein